MMVFSPSDFTNQAHFKCVNLAKSTLHVAFSRVKYQPPMQCWTLEWY